MRHSFSSVFFLNNFFNQIIKGKLITLKKTTSDQNNSIFKFSTLDSNYEFEKKNFNFFDKGDPLTFLEKK